MKLSAKEQQRKSELIERTQMIDSPNLLQEVEDILDRHASEKDFWETFSEKQQAMVRKGMEELAAGKGIPADEVMRGLPMT